jgi:hypothetical protein
MTERWLLPMLFDRCHAECSSLRRRSAAAVEASDKYRPWLPGNRDVTALGWARYSVALRKESAALDAESNSAAMEAAASLGQLLDALTDAPVGVDEFEFIKVYPKSLDSLRFIGGLGQRLVELDEEQAHVLHEVEAIQTAGSGNLDEYEREVTGIRAERTSLHRLIGWSAIYPGPSLPFSVAIRDAADLPRVPLHVQALGMEILTRIYGALVRLHTHRAAFLNSIMPLEDWEAGDYSQLIADLSEQLELPPETLSRDRSLPCLLGLAVVAGEMHDSPLAATALVS